MKSKLFSKTEKIKQRIFSLEEKIDQKRLEIFKIRGKTHQLYQQLAQCEGEAA